MSGEQQNGPDAPALRVLVVEDDKATRALLADLLEDEGFIVGTAANGKVGLTLLRAQVPDVVLLDLQMPMLDGLGVYDAMQLDPVLASVPVVFMSAAPDWHSLAQRSIRFCIRKPFDIDQFLRVVFAAVQDARRETSAVRPTSQQRAGLASPGPAPA